MSLLTLIALSNFVQLSIYLVWEKLKIEEGNILTFALLLVGHLFVFPQFFFPESDPGGVHCLMPALGITMVFWMIGGGTTIVIHAIYFLVRKFVLSRNS